MLITSRRLIARATRACRRRKSQQINARLCFMRAPSSRMLRDGLVLVRPARVDRNARRNQSSNTRLAEKWIQFRRSFRRQPETARRRRERAARRFAAPNEVKMRGHYATFAAYLSAQILRKGLQFRFTVQILAQLSTLSTPAMAARAAFSSIFFPVSSSRLLEAPQGARSERKYEARARRVNCEINSPQEQRAAGPSRLWREAGRARVAQLLPLAPRRAKTSSNWLPDLISGLLCARFRPQKRRQAGDR